MRMWAPGFIPVSLADSGAHPEAQGLTFHPSVMNRTPIKPLSQVQCPSHLYPYRLCHQMYHQYPLGQWLPTCVL